MDLYSALSWSQL